MREADAPSTGCARPTGDSYGRTTGTPILLISIRFSLEKQRGPELRRARESYPSRGLLQRCYKSATVVHYSVVPDSKRERGGNARMLFWVLAALAVVGALAIVWGLYLLVRRWL